MLACWGVYTPQESRDFPSVAGHGAEKERHPRSSPDETTSDPFRLLPLCLFDLTPN